MDLGLQFVSVDLKEIKSEQKKQRKKERKDKKQKHKASKKEESQEYSNPSLKQNDVLRDSSGSGSGKEGAVHADPLADIKDPAEGLSKASRDSWMTETAGRDILTGRVAEPPKQDTDKSKTDVAPQVTEAKTGLVDKRGTSNPARPTTTGDGGASWRLKALKRAEAQAAEEGKDLESIVSERFGSVTALTGSVGQRTAHPKAHLHASHNRMKQRDGGEPAAYLQDMDTKKMRRPDSSAPLSWRQKAPGKRHEKEDQHNEKSDKYKRQEAQQSERHRRSDRDDKAEKPARNREAKQEQAHEPTDRLQDSRQIGQPGNERESAAALNKFTNDGSFMASFAGERKPSESSGAALRSPSGKQEKFEQPYASPKADAEPDLPDPADGDNRSAAAALRARLLGKGAKDLASSPRGSQANSKGSRKVEVLPSVDAEGRAMPGSFGREAAGQGQADGGRKPKKLQRYTEGEKQVYFADDNNRSLDDLVREQRHGGGKHMDDNLADNISRKSRFRERDLDVDDEYEVDGGLDMYESRDKKVSKEKAVKRQRTSQIADLRKTDQALDNCNLCFGSPKMRKHLTIALGQTAYLSIPERGRLAPLHCCIIPVEHISSSRKTDEHIWTEMRNFKKCVLQMYMAEGLEAVFIETAIRLTDRRSHAIVHCVPLDSQAFQRAPLVFKKAMTEAESEWSQHHAKAVIDTRAKGLRGSIPPNFPYFFVEFGLSAGFLHVIDDEEKFEKDFGRSILAGLLGLGAESQHRGARAEPDVVIRKYQSEFVSKFDAYDWTKQLD